MTQEAVTTLDQIEWTPAKRQFFMDRLLEVCREKGDWAGVPVPFTEFKVLLAPGMKSSLAGQMVSTVEEASYRFAPASSGRVHRTVLPHKGLILIRWKDDEGKLHAYADGLIGQRFDLYMAAVRARQSLLADAEIKALERLQELLSETKFGEYLLSGCWIERSPRSGLAYMFRKGLPTLAIRSDLDEEGIAQPIAALCMHPLGYYDGTHCGVLAPTDDVIAAVLMMRGDEPYFWRKSHQINPIDPLAGL